MQYIFIYIHLYISIYISIYILKKRTQRSAFFYVLLQKNETFSRSFTFFAKEQNVLCVLLRSLQKNVAFSAFFYALKKRTHRSFGSHKSPKARKKNVKAITWLMLGQFIIWYPPSSPFFFILSPNTDRDDGHHMIDAGSVHYLMYTFLPSLFFTLCPNCPNPMGMKTSAILANNGLSITG